MKERWRERERERERERINEAKTGTRILTRSVHCYVVVTLCYRCQLVGPPGEQAETVNSAI